MQQLYHWTLYRVFGEFGSLSVDTAHSSYAAEFWKALAVDSMANLYTLGVVFWQ